MSKLVSAGRRAGLVSTWLGVASAGAAVGFAAERYVMGRSLKRDDPYADEPLGSLSGRALTVTTDDGVALHVDVDDAPATAGTPTIVFTNGFALTGDSWHFQRRDLRGTARLVFWDQRGHGRSDRLPDGQALTFDRLGADLAHVIDAVAPQGPLILAGHSMGAMTVTALAAARPELFGERVVGAMLVANSVDKLNVSGFGLPGVVGRLAGRAAPGAVTLLARRPDLVELGRRMGSDLSYVLTRRYGFADGGSPRLVEFTKYMNAAIPIDVVAAYFPLFGELDASDALPALGRIPVSVVAGECDLVIPVEHTRAFVERLPDVAYVEATDAGHMVLLERHELVTEALTDLLRRVRRHERRSRRTKTRVASMRQPRKPRGRSQK